MRIRKEKECITNKFMKISSEQQFKYFYTRYHHDPKKGVQQLLPEWVDSKNRQSTKVAQEVCAAIKAICNLRIASWKLIQDQQDFFDMAPAERARAIMGFVGLRNISKTNSQNLLQEMLIELSEVYSKNLEVAKEVAIEIRNTKNLYELMYELICQGFDRNGAMCTPSDIAELMVRIGGGSNTSMDVYADYGYGLYVGAKQSTKTKINLIGNEKTENSNERILSERLDVAYQQAGIAIDRHSLLERMLVELEWVLNYDYERSEVLLINAAKNELPFFELKEDPSIKGSLNHLLGLGYKKIIVLVPNTYLNGGRGLINSQEIFKYCISRGLKKVIQLPMGSIGATHEAYSLLTFEPQTVTKSIEFKVMDFGPEKDPTRLFQPAERGFGKPLRQVELNLRAIGQNGEIQKARSSVVDIDNLLKPKEPKFLNNKRQSRLISFEANRFIKSELPTNVKDRFEFGRLSDFIKIYRIQHMQLGTPEHGIEYLEIGGNDINQFGKFNLKDLPKKYIDINSKGRLEKAELNPGDLILCIRGSVGKVSLIDDTDKLAVAPNQSFVKLTLNSKNKEISPEFIFWWLSSKTAQEYMSSQVLSAGVPRLSILDVAEIPIPIGPMSEILIEMERYKNWDLQVREAIRKMHQAQEMSSKAFIFD